MNQAHFDVHVNERGQITIPKELRDKINIYRSVMIRPLSQVKYEKSTLLLAIRIC